jgi:hypothetical protein
MFSGPTLYFSDRKFQHHSEIIWLFSGRAISRRWVEREDGLKGQEGSIRVCPLGYYPNASEENIP